MTDQRAEGTETALHQPTRPDGDVDLPPYTDVEIEEILAAWNGETS